MKDFKIQCPSCKGHVEVPGVMLGTTIQCPHCNTTLALNARDKATEATQAKKPKEGVPVVLATITKIEIPFQEVLKLVFQVSVALLLVWGVVLLLWTRLQAPKQKTPHSAKPCGAGA